MSRTEHEEGWPPRDLGDLTIEELERQEGLVLPDREALSPITPRLPVDPGFLPAIDPEDLPREDVPRPETPREGIGL